MTAGLVPASLFLEFITKLFRVLITCLNFVVMEMMTDQTALKLPFTISRNIAFAFMGLMAFVAYNILFQSFYNMVAYKAIYPYDSTASMLETVSVNFSAILLIGVITIS